MEVDLEARHGHLADVGGGAAAGAVPWQVLEAMAYGARVGRRRASKRA